MLDSSPKSKIFVFFSNFFFNVYDFLSSKETIKQIFNQSFVFVHSMKGNADKNILRQFSTFLILCYTEQRKL